jgi:hypothetical protein
MTKLIGKVSQYEKIIAFMRDPNGDDSGLTEHEQQLVLRWNEAWTMLRNYHSTADTAALLMKRFPGISRATAYRDCADAISLFGDISKSTKEGIRHLATEITRDAIAIAKEKNNEDGMLKGANNLAKINGVNDTDPDLPDFSLLEAHTYEFGLPPNALKVLEGMLAGGKIDLTDMVNEMSNHAEDVDFEEEDEDVDDH